MWVLLVLCTAGRDLELQIISDCIVKATHSNEGGGGVIVLEVTVY